MAWAYAPQPDDIDVVTSWEAEFNHCSDLEKVPTQLLFSRGNRCTTWGYGVPATWERPQQEAIRWFKLLLLDDKDVPADIAQSSQYMEAIRLQKQENKDSLEIVSCFLKRLWDHTTKVITTNVGAELINKCKFRVVITMPAIWPHYTHQRMIQAVEKAGITSKRKAGPTIWQFVSEPEAAALAAIKDLSKRSTIKVSGDLNIYLISKCTKN